MISRAAVATALLLATACTASPEREASLAGVSDGRYTMGTVLEIALHGIERGPGRELLDELFTEVARLDALMSLYVDTSDVARLNAAEGREIPVAESVADVLGRSLEFSRVTNGAFDVTVGPLVELWTEAGERNRVPSPAELRVVRERVGFRHIRVRRGAARLLLPKMSVDLGGIAKGYALDSLLPLLEARGVDSALLNFGQSSTWARGAPPAAEGWRLLVRGPDGGFAGILTLRDQALSISGSLGQFTEIDGRRYGHILDPRTGQPLLRARQTVIVAPRADLAEALSKALLVLDAVDGLARVTSQPGCEGLLIEAGGALRMTPGFAEAVRFEPATAWADPSSQR